MKNLTIILFLTFICGLPSTLFSQVLVEAESFTNKGGWVIDQQFMDQMGSPYLLAHGMGKPVKDAETNISIKKAGKYHVWVRTKNWVPGNWEAPGRFYVAVEGKQLVNQLGKKVGWNWEYAGNIELSKGEKKLSLKDLTGFLVRSRGG